MENIQRYKGTVIAVRPNHAFIGLSSVVRLDGSLSGLKTEHDIFVHKKEMVGQQFKVGMEISFEVSDDDRSNKEGALRADKALLAGVQLQFPELTVDHPLVPVTWCFDSAMIDYIKARAKENFGLVIGAVSNGSNYSETKVLEWHLGLDALMNARSFLSFRAPGEYQVFVYLVQFSSGERHAKNSLKKMKVKKYDPVRSDTGEIIIEGGYDLPFFEDLNGRVIGVSTLTLSVPDGIFAKPITGWKKDWFCYFWKKNLEDDCDRRPKEWFAFTLGFPVYLVWELLKRTFFVLLSMAFILCGHNALEGIKRVFKWKLSVHKDEMEIDTPAFTNYKGWRNVLRPVTPVALVALVVAASYYQVVLDALIVLGVGIPLFLLAVWMWSGLFRNKDWEREQAEVVAMNRLVQKFEQAVACGAVPTSRPVSVRLRFLGIKRKFCRNYNRD